MAVSIHTLRAHLRHLFYKTNTRRQAELTLLSLASVGRNGVDLLLGIVADATDT